MSPGQRRRRAGCDRRAIGKERFLRERDFVRLDGEDREERGHFKFEGREKTEKDAAINEEREGEGKKRDPGSRWRHVSHPDWAGAPNIFS
ncbi:hypothetical protein EUGRSUZ_A02431 [Eucalyptus grandis]|uniref:Uncharacterized protein n=2 Tax=Eucalyptus grandis TaxID=71139 RepID=A0ACC3M6F3_EUCGR|nr:hypothetical protein EUGRSUZ_A02431 [Eucalyptus grandis]